MFSNNDLSSLDYSSIIAEYVWVSSHGNIMSKTRALSHDIGIKLSEKKELSNYLSNIPYWEYIIKSVESNENERNTKYEKIILRPVALYNNPFYAKNGLIVLCETLTLNGNPTHFNFRHFADKVFTEENIQKFCPWFGIEQEYVLVKYYGSIKWPLGWKQGEFPNQTDDYYCSNNAHTIFGRIIIEEHLKACLFAGVNLYGINSEYLPSQWEYQIEHSVGIKPSDDLVISRFLLIRIAENHGVSISFDPKLFDGLAGSGGHVNYSTKQTRDENGYDTILEHMEKLSKYQEEAISLYGENNDKRLKGIWDAPSLKKFTYGLMNRKASVRISKKTFDDKKGFYEDRRPAANLDPYIVCSFLFSITCLEGNIINDLLNQYELYKERES